MDEQNNTQIDITSTNDATPKVTGIGGIFFFSDNPEETRACYAKNVGFDINAWGSASFETRNVDKPDEVHALQWSPFKKGDDYFAPSTKEFMINYRVRHIEALVDKLRENASPSSTTSPPTTTANSFTSWTTTATKLNAGNPDLPTSSRVD
jgi:hypothetical protein